MAVKPKSGKPSQRDIAQAVNVSQATVSFVLSNRSAQAGISVDTQRRVEEAAHRLGYSPNVAAQSLRGGRTGLIGVYTYERIFPASPEHYYHQFLVGIEEEASSLGLDLVLFTSAQKSSVGSVYSEGHNRMRLADGAVILGARKDDEDLRRLSDEGFPIVSIGRQSALNYRITTVAADYRSVLLDTVTQLRTAGHERVLYVGHVERLTARQDRFEGFLAGCVENHIAPNAPALLDPPSIDSAWLTSVVASGITAIVAETLAHAQAVHAAALGASVRVPSELSLVCLDVSPNPGTFVPWSHITVPRYEMGRQSLQLLHKLLDGATEPGDTESLPCGPALPTTIAPARPTAF